MSGSELRCCIELIHSLASFVFWCISHCAARGCREHISFSIVVVSFRMLWWHFGKPRYLQKGKYCPECLPYLYWQLLSFVFFPSFLEKKNRGKDLILPLGIFPCFWQEMNSHSFGFIAINCSCKAIVIDLSLQTSPNERERSVKIGL